MRQIYLFGSVRICCSKDDYNIFLIDKHFKTLYEPVRIDRSTYRACFHRYVSVHAIKVRFQDWERMEYPLARIGWDTRSPARTG